jgi:hypothetical protein
MKIETKIQFGDSFLIIGDNTGNIYDCVGTDENKVWYEKEGQMEAVFADPSTCIKIIREERLNRSDIQRFIALENSFKTIDAFIIPSASPDILDKYEDIKEYLLKIYTKEINPGDLNNYKF